MTVNKVLAQVNELEPNTYGDEDKARWLADVDGRVAVEVQGAPPPEYGAEKWDGNLLVPAPYDNLYLHYVLAMIHFHNREYENYNAARTLFEAAMDEYRKWYVRTNRGAPGTGFTGVF